MIRLFIISILIIALVAVGCSKKQEEVDALQQEATGEDAAAVIDSMEGVGTQTAGQDQPAMTETVAEEPEPEPEPDYSQIEGFVVQLGSYNNYDLAYYWAEKYQNRDFPAFLSEVELDGRIYYRLRVGIYETFEEAKQVGELLADRYSARYWIDNNR